MDQGSYIIHRELKRALQRVSAQCPGMAKRVFQFNVTCSPESLPDGFFRRMSEMRGAVQNTRPRPASNETFLNAQRKESIAKFQTALIRTCRHMGVHSYPALTTARRSEIEEAAEQNQSSLSIMYSIDYFRSTRDIQTILRETQSSAELVCSAREITTHIYEDDGFRMFRLSVARIKRKRSYQAEVSYYQQYMIMDAASGIYGLGKTPKLAKKKADKAVIQHMKNKLEG